LCRRRAAAVEHAITPSNEQSDMFNRHLLAVAGLALAAGTSFAQGTAHEDERNATQEARIRQGEANGSLTPREAAHLQRQQHEIHRAERRAAADGTISPAERARIRRMQDHASQSISDKKHNDRVND
jgi:hypothetical protein